MSCFGDFPAARWVPPDIDWNGEVCIPLHAVPSSFGLLTEYIGRGAHARWGLLVGRVVEQRGRLILFAAAGRDRVVKLTFPEFRGLEILATWDTIGLDLGWVRCWGDLPSTAVQGGWDSVAGKALFIGRTLPNARYRHVGSILDRSGRLLISLGGAALEESQYEVLCGVGV